jgi:hypothetical protein
MKLNMDCIRDILIAVESLNYGDVYTISKLHDNLPKYSEETLDYHCRQLTDAGFLDALTINATGGPYPNIVDIRDLTFSGHQFLADIRSDTTWNKTKDMAKSVGVESLHAIRDIAVGVVTSIVQNKLGLH